MKVIKLGMLLCIIHFSHACASSLPAITQKERITGSNLDFKQVQMDSMTMGCHLGVKGTLMMLQVPMEKIDDNQVQAFCSKESERFLEYLAKQI